MKTQAILERLENEIAAIAEELAQIAPHREFLPREFEQLNRELELAQAARDKVLQQDVDVVDDAQLDDAQADDALWKGDASARDAATRHYPNSTSYLVSGKGGVIRLPLTASMPAESRPKTKLASSDALSTRPNVGAWCGSRLLADPQGQVEGALAHNINRLDLMINDHAKWRTPSRFTMRDLGKIERAVAIAQRHGLEVHFTSWIMPHEQYLDSAAQTLLPLLDRLQIASIQWDAEEPWMLAKNPMPYTMAAQHLQRNFSSRTCPMGVNGIGYASVEKMRPLVDVCDFMVPQAYATSTSGISPDGGPGKLIARWRKQFGDRKLYAGLAAYRQTQIPGYDATGAMQASLASAREQGDVDTFIYWHLTDILKNSDVGAVVAGIRK